MTLLKVNNASMTNLRHKSSSTEGQPIEEYSEDNSYEISDKFEVSKANIDETETKKKETV